MKDEDVTAARWMLGQAVLDIQERFKEEYTPEEVLPEIIAALLSLAANIATINCRVSRSTFIEACEIAAKEMPTREVSNDP